MLGHYLATAYRTFRRRPVTTAVNVIALSLGLTCFVAAYAVVSYWDHAEQGFAKADRTYVMTGKIHIKSGGFEVGPIPSIDTTLVDTLREDFPQFEIVARATNAGDKPIVAGDKKVRLFAAYADKQFLDVFDLPFVAGDARTALDKPESAVLTTEAAERLFGTTNVVGRSFRYDGLVDLTVTGVIGDIPQPSHIGRSQTSELRFDVLASWDVSDRIDAVLAKAGRQGASGEAITYVVLPKGSAVTPQLLAPAFAAYVQRRVPEAQRNFMDLTLGMIPVREMMASRLNTMLLSATGIGISISTLLILLGGLVLVVACVNCTVLATGHAIVRAKEVGLRKVIGAGRRQIVAQHLLEAGILTGLGLILAVAATEALAPVVQQASGVDLSLLLLSGAGFWLFVFAMLVGVTLVAGAYPALVLSKVRPIHALRQGGIHGGAGRVQSLFVGVQFCVASFLLIVVIVMWAQTGDLRRTGLGTDTDPLIVITNNHAVTKLDSETLEQALRRLPQVKAVSGMSIAPWSGQVVVSAVTLTPGQGAISRTSFANEVDYGFFAAMDMKVVSGRVFERARGEDKPIAPGATPPRTPFDVVIDEAFSRQIGAPTPQEAVGKNLYLPAGPNGRQLKARIIGVVANKPLHFSGLGTSSNMYTLDPNPESVLVRLSKDDVSGALKAVRQVWDKMAPGHVLQYDFEDQLFAKGYAMFLNLGRALNGLALFALAISIIGLFGTAIHAANRRRHEIGVRKTLGASTRRILAMLLKDFSKPVIIANVIAWPIGYIAAKAYLNIFIHRIALSPLPFLLSLVIAIAIAWASVGGQALRAARTKPASVLRYE